MKYAIPEQQQQQQSNMAMIITSVNLIIEPIKLFEIGKKNIVTVIYYNPSAILYNFTPSV